MLPLPSNPPNQGEPLPNECKQISPSPFQLSEEHLEDGLDHLMDSTFGWH